MGTVLRTEAMNKMPYLNLGCGHRYRSDWINIDVCAYSADVLAHDLSLGIPLHDASCEIVYHSSMLEHVRVADALPFMQECYRVLKPGGMIRVATPDLERICRIYLQKLDAVLAGDSSEAHDYDWIMLEMYDQAVREASGGAMLDYLRQNPLLNESFVLERIGVEGQEIMQSVRAKNLPARRNTQRSAVVAFARRFRNLSRSLPVRVMRRLAGPESFVTDSKARRALQIGRFRLSGEAHHWLYDRYSLSRLMLKAGFSGPVQQTAVTSLVPDWRSFNLDTLADGTVVKPDSLYMEAVKAMGSSS